MLNEPVIIHSGNACKTSTHGAYVVACAFAVFFLTASASAGPILIRSSVAVRAESTLGPNVVADSDVASQTSTTDPLSVNVIAEAIAGPGTFARTVGSVAAQWTSVSSGTLSADFSGLAQINDDLLFKEVDIMFNGVGWSQNAWTMTFIPDTNGSFYLDMQLSPGKPFMWQWYVAGTIVHYTELGTVDAPTVSTITQSITAGVEHTAVITWGAGLGWSGNLGRGHYGAFDDVGGDFAWRYDTAPASPTPVPEPTTLSLFAIGVAGALAQNAKARRSIRVG